MDPDLLRIPLSSQVYLGHAGVGNEEGIVDELRRKTMKTRKILAAFGAALMMLGISMPAAAFDCTNDDGDVNPTVIQANLTAMANSLRCAGHSEVFPGLWNPDNPIWERRRTPSCDVHQKLARNLYEKREFIEGTKPRKNQNNDATGAAWNVRNGQYEEAIMKLDAFVAAILRSRLNESYDPDTAAAQYQAMMFINEAEAARACIVQLLP